MSPHPDLARSVLSQLKDFQRATVEHTVDKLFGPEDVSRFLIADEVGLGKTMVARGIVAETIDRLWDSKERIDIIYVCSNAQIAAQNLNRLNPLTDAPHQLASRITLLPLHLRDLDSRQVNLIAFTPDTSLKPGNRSGSAPERALVHHLLRAAWGSWVTQREGAWELMRGGAGLESYLRHFDGIQGRDLDSGIVAEFTMRLTHRPELEEEFRRLSDGRTWRHSRPGSKLRNRLIGHLRGVLAEACIEALEPDLVILDEFQRFTDLLDPKTEAGQLASDLFNYEDNKVLLLSATPYRMFTQRDEEVDHYEDFLKTYDFLVHHETALTAGLQDALSSLRRGLMTGEPVELLEGYSKDVEQRLRQVMVRTERLGSSPDRDGMLVTVTVPDLIPHTTDVLAYAAMDDLARDLGAPSVMELWKTAPYLLNFMEDYKFSRDFREAIETDGSKAALSVRKGHGFLPEGVTQTYEEVESGNAKLRALIDYLDQHRAFELLWVPPAMPTTSLSGAFASEEAKTFTKMLIFSSWAVAPRAIAALTSYEVERRLLGPLGKRYDERADISSPLDLRLDQTSVPVPNLLLSLPLPTLAGLADPLAFARANSLTFPLDVDKFIAAVGSVITTKLAATTARSPLEGRVDVRWYWAGALLLEEGALEQQLLALKALAPTTDRAESTPHEVLRRAKTLVYDIRAGEQQLGPPPKDLAEVLALLGLAGPANAWWRTLTREVVGSADINPVDSLGASVSLARRIVSIFSQPESQQIVRTSTTPNPYWRQVLDYCTHGGLPAVVDEFVHLLIDAIGVRSRPPDEALRSIVETVTESVGLRVATVGAREWLQEDGALRETTTPLRLHLAARIGQEQEDEKGITRAANVREAFNSPFWPFVLVSTSIGQEGLDFHPYCHAVMHWNLPSNPVDLEQREGRVHRYKGHAVRKNISKAFGSDGRVSSSGKPWESAFEAARDDRPEDASDVIPYWVFTVPQGAKIERHVLPLPLSRDVQRISDLQKSLAAYRLAFGQPRQEDLVEYLRTWYAETEQDALQQALGVNLSP